MFPIKYYILSQILLVAMNTIVKMQFVFDLQNSLMFNLTKVQLASAAFC